MRKFYKIALCTAVLAAGATTAEAYTFEGETFDKIYILGEVTSNGWNITTPNNDFALSETTPGTFTGRHILHTGTFRFNYKPDGDWSKCVSATGSNGQTFESGEVLRAGKGDWNWTNQVSGVYDITVTFNEDEDKTMTVVINNANEIYAVGPGVEGAGWDPAQAIALTNVGGQTYRGLLNLKKGEEFKFLARRDWDWGITSEYCDENESNHKGAKMQDCQSLKYGKHYTGDNKWKIANDGTYLVEVNLGDKQNVSFFPGTIAMVGPATPDEWSFSDASKFTQESPTSTVFSWEGSLKADVMKFVGARYEFDDDENTHIYPGADKELFADAKRGTVGGEDRRWYVHDGGDYKISIDVKDLSLNIENTSAENYSYTIYAELHNVGDWSDVRLYAFNSETGSMNQCWPGLPMDKKGGIYAITLHEYYDTFIVNGVKDENRVETVEINVSKDSNADHVFVIEEKDGVYGTIIDSYAVLAEGGPITFIKPEAWDSEAAPRLHYWGVESTVWPGVAMEKVPVSRSWTGDSYTAVVPAGTVGIKFVDGVDENKSSADIREVKPNSTYSIDNDGNTQTAVENIEVEAVAPIYFNLQGQRVNNPENGLFIEVRGNKVSKVIR